MGITNGQYRLLWSTLPRSKKIRAIKGTRLFRITCHLIYTWLIPWGDDDGRMCGDLLWLYANIFPHEGLTEKEIKTALQELQRVQLIYWYEISDERFIQIIDWSSHQRIRKDRYKPSIYPPWQPSVGQLSDTLQPVFNQTGDGDGDGDGDKGGSGGGYYETAKGEKLQGSNLSQFNEFWKAFSYARGKADAADRWLEICPISDELFQRILVGAKREALNRERILEEGKTPKMAQGWLNSKRWEDEIDDPYEDIEGGFTL